MKGISDTLQWTNSVLSVPLNGVNYSPLMMALCTIVLFLNAFILFLEFRIVAPHTRPTSITFSEENALDEEQGRQV